MRRKLLRPTVELFSDGEILDSIELYRHGAFSSRYGMEFPFRRLRTYRDRIELRWPNKAKPPQTILVEWRPLHFGGAFPYFLCYKCSRRVRMLYVTSIDVGCRVCSELQWQCQRKYWVTRLRTRANKIRARLDTDTAGKIIRPRYMHKTTYRQHLHTLQRIQHALETGSRIRWIRSRQQYRPRDSDGRYCD